MNERNHITSRPALSELYEALPLLSSSGWKKTAALIEEAAAYILIQGLHVEGLFRENGNISQIQALKKLTEHGKPLKLTGRNTDPHAIAGLLKLYIRDLPEPVFTAASISLILTWPDEAEDSQHDLLVQILASVDRWKRCILQLLLWFLKEVVSTSPNTTPFLLSLSFAPVLVRIPADVTPAPNLLECIQRVVQSMIENYDAVFEPGLYTVVDGKDVVFIPKGTSKRSLGKNLLTKTSLPTRSQSRSPSHSPTKSTNRRPPSHSESETLSHKPSSTHTPRSTPLVSSFPSPAAAAGRFTGTVMRPKGTQRASSVSAVFSVATSTSSHRRSLDDGSTAPSSQAHSRPGSASDNVTTSRAAQRSSLVRRGSLPTTLDVDEAKNSQPIAKQDATSEHDSLTRPSDPTGAASQGGLRSAEGSPVRSKNSPESMLSSTSVDGGQSGLEDSPGRTKYSSVTSLSMSECDSESLLWAKVESPWSDLSRDQSHDLSRDQTGRYQSHERSRDEGHVPSTRPPDRQQYVAQRGRLDEVYARVLRTSPKAKNSNQPDRRAGRPQGPGRRAKTREPPSGRSESESEPRPAPVRSKSGDRAMSSSSSALVHGRAPSVRVTLSGQGVKDGRRTAHASRGTARGVKPSSAINSARHQIGAGDVAKNSNEGASSDNGLESQAITLCEQILHTKQKSQGLEQEADELRQKLGRMLSPQPFGPVASAASPERRRHDYVSTLLSQIADLSEQVHAAQNQRAVLEDKVRELRKQTAEASDGRASRSSRSASTISPALSTSSHTNPTTSSRPPGLDPAPASLSSPVAQALPPPRQGMGSSLGPFQSPPWKDPQAWGPPAVPRFSLDDSVSTMEAELTRLHSENQRLTDEINRILHSRPQDTASRHVQIPGLPLSPLSPVFPLSPSSLPPTGPTTSHDVPDDVSEDIKGHVQRLSLILHGASSSSWPSTTSAKSVTLAAQSDSATSAAPRPPIIPERAIDREKLRAVLGSFKELRSNRDDLRSLALQMRSTCVDGVSKWIRCLNARQVILKIDNCDPALSTMIEESVAAESKRGEQQRMAAENADLRQQLQVLETRVVPELTRLIEDGMHESSKLRTQLRSAHVNPTSPRAVPAVQVIGPPFKLSMRRPVPVLPAESDSDARVLEPDAVRTASSPPQKAADLFPEFTTSFKASSNKDESPLSESAVDLRAPIFLHAYREKMTQDLNPQTLSKLPSSETEGPIEADVVSLSECSEAASSTQAHQSTRSSYYLYPASTRGLTPEPEALHDSTDDDEDGGQTTGTGRGGTEIEEDGLLETEGEYEEGEYEREEEEEREDDGIAGSQLPSGFWNFTSTTK